MKNILSLIQIFVAIVLITLVILQSKGVGLGRSFGGGGEFYKSRRGVEKIIFRLTIIFASLFLVSSIANLIVL